MSRMTPEEIDQVTKRYTRLQKLSKSWDYGHKHTVSGRGVVPFCPIMGGFSEAFYNWTSSHPI